MSLPQPVGNKLLAKPIAASEEIVGRIILPGTTNANLEKAEVVAVSSEVEGIFVGDIVTFPQGTGLSQMIEGKPYLWLQNMEVWGIIQPEPNAA
jgi:co-chaperonin GroES (HSP10)